MVSKLTITDNSKSNTSVLRTRWKVRIFHWMNSTFRVHRIIYSHHIWVYAFLWFYILLKYTTSITCIIDDFLSILFVSCEKKYRSYTYIVTYILLKKKSSVKLNINILFECFLMILIDSHNTILISLRCHHLRTVLYSVHQ